MEIQFRNCLSRLVMVASVFAAVPAQAERWQELPYKKGATYRIDLDSLQWDGRTVKYTVEITTIRNGLPHRVFSTGLINCETGQRRTIELAYPLPNGTARKEPRNDRWRTIEPYWASESSRRFLCLNEKVAG